MDFIDVESVKSVNRYTYIRIYYRHRYDRDTKSSLTAAPFVLSAYYDLRFTVNSPAPTSQLALVPIDADFRGFPRHVRQKRAVDVARMWS